VDAVTSAIELEGWIPFRLYFADRQLLVDWCYLGDETLSEPFFYQTINVCLDKPFNLLFRRQTPIESLVELNRTRPGLYPTGFIFHLSRCGSTLVAQMLAALPESIVISEAPPIDFVIRARSEARPITVEQRIEWLRGIVHSLGGQRKGKERYYFIKFDAWHMLDLPLLRQAFPGVPWIFLYRDPVEVMVAQVAQPSPFMLPGFTQPDLPPVLAGSLESTSVVESLAGTLGKIATAALTYAADGGTLINYCQLPDAVATSLLDFFGVSCSPQDLEKLEQVSRRHAKNPVLPFATDSQSKKEKATREIREAAGKWLYPVYEKLEAARILQASPGGVAES